MLLIGCTVFFICDIVGKYAYSDTGIDLRVFYIILIIIQNKIQPTLNRRTFSDLIPYFVLSIYIYIA